MHWVGKNLFFDQQANNHQTFKKQTFGSHGCTRSFSYRRKIGVNQYGTTWWSNHLNIALHCKAHRFPRNCEGRNKCCRFWRTLFSRIWRTQPNRGKPQQDERSTAWTVAWQLSMRSTGNVLLQRRLIPLAQLPPIMLLHWRPYPLKHIASIIPFYIYFLHAGVFFDSFTGIGQVREDSLQAACFKYLEWVAIVSTINSF